MFFLSIIYYTQKINLHERCTKQIDKFGTLSEKNHVPSTLQTKLFFQKMKTKREIIK